MKSPFFGLLLATALFPFRPGHGATADSEVPRLIEQLKSDQWRTQAAAARALGKIGSPAKEAVPLLVEIIKDRRTQEWLFRDAAGALPKMQPESHVAIPVLIEFVTHAMNTPRQGDDYSAREVYAMSSLAMFGPHASDAVPALLKRLQTDEPPPPRTPGYGEAENLANALLRMPNRRMTAARALGLIAPGDEAVMRVFIEFVRDSSLTGRNLAIREAVIQALGDMGPRAKPAVPVLREFLSKGHYGRSTALKRAAQNALKKIDPSLKQADLRSRQVPGQVDSVPGAASANGQERVVHKPSAPPHPSKKKTLDLGGGVEMELVFVEPGTFMMGSPDDEEKRSSNEGPTHKVTISKGFWMGKSEVTQEQYRQVMGNNPSHFKGKRNPVEQISWNDAKTFCEKVREKLTSDVRLRQSTCRLPTEAEWEYACRAGTTTRFYIGDSEGKLAEAAWYSRGSKGRSHPVGQKRPNAWGLHDMHGNVWEWCQDWFGNYPAHDVTDPVGPDSGPRRVLRGGSWYNYASYCRVARRFRSPLPSNSRIGFRVCLPPSQETQATESKPRS